MTLGKTTARAALDQELEGSIAEVTGLTRLQVKRRLSEVHGRQQVRNVFVDEWPRGAGQLAHLRTSLVRRAGLWEELAIATGLSEFQVEQRLAGVHGRKLMRNLFGQELFGEAFEEIEAEDEDDGASSATDASEDEGEDDAEDASYLNSSRRPRRRLAPKSWAGVSSASDTGQSVGPDAPAAPAGPAETALVPTTSTEPPQFATGTTLRGRYRLGQKLGEGGFGTAFEAQDELTSRVVVVKLPREPAHEELLRTEAELTWKVHHPGVCRTWLDTDPSCGLFLVSEHAGRSIIDWIDASGPLAADFAIDVVGQIAGALDYAHERDVIHLDVSCANVLVDDQGIAKLIDFGAGRTGRRVTDGADAGTVLATSRYQQPIFAAPEQLAGSGRPRSDQYALGLVLVSMLRGVVMAKRYEMVHDDPRFEMPGLSSMQRQVVERALDFSPKERFASCGEFAAALRANHETPDDLVSRRLRELHVRLEKVLEGTDRTTVAVGQSMRAAGAFEAFLRAVAIWVAGSESALRSRLQRFDRATCAQLADAIVQLAGEPSSRRIDVAWIVDDLRSRRGVCWAAVRGRNEVAHGRANTLPADVALELAMKVGALVRRTSSTTAE
jgi:hypothetical protein